MTLDELIEIRKQHVLSLSLERLQNAAINMQVVIDVLCNEKPDIVEKIKVIRSELFEGEINE